MSIKSSAVSWLGESDTTENRSVSGSGIAERGSAKWLKCLHLWDLDRLFFWTRLPYLTVPQSIGRFPAVTHHPAPQPPREQSAIWWHLVTSSVSPACAGATGLASCKAGETYMWHEKLPLLKLKFYKTKSHVKLSTYSSDIRTTLLAHQSLTLRFGCVFVCDDRMQMCW